MNAAMILSFQVLFFLLPITRGTIHKIYGEIQKFGIELVDDDAQESHPEFIGKEGNVAVIPPSIPLVCWGNPPYCFDMKTMVSKLAKDKANQSPLKTRAKPKRGKNWIVCYEDIDVVFTPECPALQSTDFSDLYITDFCVGDDVRIKGTIDFLVGMSRPTSVFVSVTRVQDTRLDSYRKPRGYSFTFDGCDFMSKIICSFVPQRWCGCPLREGVLVFNQNGLSVQKDFLPRKMRMGRFNAKLTIDSPEDSTCVNIAFTRRQRQAGHQRPPMTF